MMAEKIAIVRVRGECDVKKDIKDTLKMLGLQKINWATIIDPTPCNMGMINKAKDFITWGEIDEKTLGALIAKWGRKGSDKRLESKEAEELTKAILAGKSTLKDAGVKKVFRLHPPTKGHPAAGIKVHVNIGGALGYRGAKINSLIQKMGGIKE